MRKISLIGLMLVAVGAFLALATTPAFALAYTLAEWLDSGNVITSAITVDATGEALWENISNKADILCGALAVGTVGPDGEDTVTEVFNLSGTKIEELDGSSATKGISCTGDSLCETGTEVWPVNLPYLSLLVLDTTEEKWYDLTLENSNKQLPAFNANCKTIIGTVNELCVSVAESGGEVINVTGGVEARGAIEPLGTCNGTANVCLIEALPGGLATLTGGGTLSISG